jgi:plastocyanin
MSDEQTPSETPEDSGAPGPEGADSAEGGGVAVAVREEPAPTAVPMGPAEDPRLEQRKTRFWLPLLIPVGAVAAVAFFTLNLSRVFIAAAEESHNFTLLIAIGITLSILIGASVIAALPQIRTTSLVVGMSVVTVVVLLAGSLVLGASLPESESEAGYVEPAGPAINELEVDALPTLKFQATRFEVPAGINLINYIDKGGTHTLVFDDNAVPGFLLAVPDGRASAKVELEEGDYVIYCTIPGHRAAGMEADLIAGPPPADPVPEPGTESPTETTVPAAGTETTIPGAGADDGASQSSTGGTGG